MTSLSRSRVVVALLLVLGLTVLVAAQCVVQAPQVQETITETEEGAAEPVAEEAAAKKVLRIANAEPTQGTSPLTGGTCASSKVWDLMHDPLWDRDENFEPIPWLAESWETNDDFTTWTFKLREGLTFSDGSEITAEDVKASLEYLGTSELYTGRIEQFESVEVVDPLTVEISTTRPMPDFMVMPGCIPQFSIFSKDAIEAGADWNEVQQSVYSGPYILQEYVPKSHLVMVKNPNYWMEGYPKFDEIFWSFTEDATAGVAAVESGAAHYYDPVPAKDVPRLREMSNVVVYEADSPNYMGFGFDRNLPFFNDSRVRRAIALTLEPEERTEVCWFGTGSSLYGGFIYEWQTDFFDGFEPYKTPRDERVENANALLDEAGWVEGPDGVRVSQGVEGLEDGTPFEVNVPYEANWPAAECHTQLLQNWGQDVGLVFNPERYDPGNFWNDAIDGKHAMWHAGIPASTYAPDSFYQVFHVDGSWQPYYFHGDEPELNALLDEMIAEVDLIKKKELMSEINRLLSEGAYVVADGSQNTLVLTTAELEGFFARPDDSNRALILSDFPAE